MFVLSFFVYITYFSLAYKLATFHIQFTLFQANRVNPHEVDTIFQDVGRQLQDNVLHYHHRYIYIYFFEMLI